MFSVNKLKVLLNKFLIKIPLKINYKFILKDYIPLLELKLSSQVLETKRFTQNIKTIKILSPSKKKILVLAPHIDDEIFGAGGTLIGARDNDCEIVIVFIAAKYETNNKTQQVRKESNKVCQELNAKSIYLNYETRQVPFTVYNELVNVINDFIPNIIMTTFILDDHDDHRRVNLLLSKAIELIKTKNIEIWMFQIYTTVIPNVIVDITEYIKEKEKLMKIYNNVPGNRDWSHYILGMNAMSSRFLSSKDKKYGEVFFILPCIEYIEICNMYFNNPKKEIFMSNFYHHD